MPPGSFPHRFVTVVALLQVMAVLVVWCWAGVNAKFMPSKFGPSEESLFLRDHGWLLLALPALWTGWYLRNAHREGVTAFHRAVGIGLLVVILVGVPMLG